MHRCSLLPASLPAIHLVSLNSKPSVGAAGLSSTTHARTRLLGDRREWHTATRQLRARAAAQGLRLTCVLLKAPSNRDSSLREGRPPRRKRSPGKQAPHLERFQSFHPEEHRPVARDRFPPPFLYWVPKRIKVDLGSVRITMRRFVRNSAN